MRKIILLITLIFFTSSYMQAENNQGGIPYGTVWGFPQIEQLKAAVDADPQAKSYSIEGFTITPEEPGKIVVDTEKKHIRLPMTISFVASEDGDACLRMKVKVTKGKKMLVSLAKKRVKDSRILDNTSSDKAMYGTYDILVPGVKAGDEIRIESFYSSYNCIYSLEWKLNQ